MLVTLTIFIIENCKLDEKKKTEKLADFKKLTFYLEMLKPYELYQNISFSDSKCYIN